MRARSLLAIVALLAAVPLHAQRPQTAVVPQTITVGDVFHAAIRVDLPAGSSLAAADSITLVPELEQAGRMEVRYDTAGGGRRATLLYPLTAWKPGAYQLPPVNVSIVADGSATTMQAELPAFSVRSVLPADTAALEPKGAKDVLGASRVWWPIILGIVVALVIVAALYWWWRRRRPAVAEAAPSVPAVPPRRAALDALDALEGSGLLERGELRTYYAVLTETLRHYAAAVDPRWSVDLTTSELAMRVRARQRHVEMIELIRILGAGDLVKFARAVLPADVARADLEAARMWVKRTGPEVVQAPAEQRRAA